MKEKLRLMEWYAKEDDGNIEEATEFILGLLDKNSLHLGDCTNHSCLCELCVLETILQSYREYCFDKEITNE